MHASRHIMLVDDHPVVRLGLVHLLEEKLHDLVVGQAGSAAEARALLRERNWDLMILDLSLPEESGLAFLGEVRTCRPQLPVLVLSVFPPERYAKRAMKAGATAYLAKHRAPEELKQTVKQLLENGRVEEPDLAAGPVKGAQGELADRLSNRELEVLRLLATGETVTQVALRLKRSVKTISTHRTRVLRKLQLKTTADLIRFTLVNDCL
jgi:two-component system invasion response regulator UvrY